MKKYPLLFWALRRGSVQALILILFLSASCSPKVTPDPNAAIRQSVAATIAAIPAATSAPTYTPYPRPTAQSLRGLFCEYSFCIAHPSDVAFFDVSAQQNPASPSTYSQGLLAAFNANLFIQLIWQYAPGSTDPQFLMDLILEDGLDTRTGNLDIQLVRDLNVLASPITSTASPLLPFGMVAGWVCADRVFAWKVYSPTDGAGQSLLQEALAKFVCEK